jgi:hypothetical protein
VLLKRHLAVWYQQFNTGGLITCSKYTFANHVAKQHHLQQLRRRVFTAWLNDGVKKNWKKKMAASLEVGFTKSKKLVDGNVR